ncbi:DUF4124 domain-containing protein [Solemya elarraichensis gill symbiont]|uniref:DUF4124 domain-containing protein n=1 Tax=Solemya elarraichensis gill symbiont TaxID=1918949 RepID=A0A1T2LDA9_9GAMM|nr:DUF4124 domain-containing protein [Solemya elarraichensis gill symbiont]OOZ43097.1 hypothetical protein BOW52_00245 [Solemya elarraichensis gill symbiont]
MITFRFAILTSITVVALAIASQLHAGLYRWVDENGKVHYSDSMPPEVALKGSDVLNKQGIRVMTITPPKSKDEQKAIIDDEHARRIEEQRNKRQIAADKSLISAYRHERDILEARDENIAIVSAAELVINGNIHRARLHLLHMSSLTDKQVSDLKKLLHRNYVSLFRYDHEREGIEEKYNGLLLRYRHIQRHGPGATTPMGDSPDSDVPFLSCHNVHLKCPDAETCGRWWKRTKQYLNENSDMPLLIETDTLLSTQMPIQREDISLSAAFEPKGANGYGEILLDLDCGDISPSGERQQTSHEGECFSQRSKGISKQFRPFVTGAY